MLRKVLSIIFWLMGALLGWIALTVPMTGSAGPAILMLTCFFVGWKLWPRKSEDLELPDWINQ